MAGTYKAEEQSPILYHPIPELREPQSAAVASEVDTLLDSVMERVHVSTERLRQFEARFLHSDYSASPLDCNKRFLMLLLRENKDLQLPETFFAPLLRIAVYEADPSFNRSFIEPSLRAFGYRRTQEELLRYLEEGTNREKAGAARALYWAQLPLLLPHWNDLYPQQTWSDQEAYMQAVEEYQDKLKKAEQAFQKMCDEELAGLRSQIAITMLKEFVENEDLDVRRSLIPHLSFRASHYPEIYKPLIPVALSIARNHPDDYIRQRVEIQVKEGGNSEH